MQRDCVVLWEWGSLRVTDCVVQLIFVSAARIVALVLLTSLLTLSTSTTELAHGTEGVLAPLQRMGFPAHELALIVVVALRFVPTLALQMERIVKAQVARGADFGTEGGFQFIRRTRRMLPLLIPLFLVSLRRAETLAIAMEARGYTGGSGRTRRKRLHAEGRDYVALLMALFLCAGILVADRLVLDGAIGLLLEMLPF
jgi:energy-coupling factor transport system permease protein